MKALRRAWLRVAVRLLARRPKLVRVPGWYFGIGEESPTRSLARRKRLWEQGVLLGYPSVRLPWFERLSVRTRLGTDLSRCLFVTGSYEPNEFALLSEILEVGGNFVDVGANEGLYTLFASRRVGKSG
ncbi:MAG: hypothetical protein MJE66_24345, partial [Proteobacteria bacterium]|nr:hypothetical protein [Pseudomonadota bacterium]